MDPLGKFLFYSRSFMFYLAVTGALLILFGVLFIVWPTFLVALVSVFFIGLGLVSLSLAWRVYLFEKKMSATIKHMEDKVSDGIDSVVRSLHL